MTWTDQSPFANSFGAYWLLASLRAGEAVLANLVWYESKKVDTSEHSAAERTDGRQESMALPVRSKG